MDDVLIVKAEIFHIDHIASNMRYQDKVEVMASDGMDPFEALHSGFYISSKCWVAVLKDSPIAMFGVAPVSIMSGIGSPWLLGTDDITKIKRQFLVHSRNYVAKMLELYPFLKNFVDARNDASIRWLSKIGFQIHSPMKYGINGEYFHPFSMERSCVTQQQ